MPADPSPTSPKETSRRASKEGEAVIEHGVHMLTEDDRSYVDRLDANRNVRLAMEQAASAERAKVEAAESKQRAEAAAAKAVAAKAAAEVLAEKARVEARAAAMAAALRKTALERAAVKMRERVMGGGGGEEQEVYVKQTLSDHKMVKRAYALSHTHTQSAQLRLRLSHTAGGNPPHTALLLPHAAASPDGTSAAIYSSTKASALTLHRVCVGACVLPGEALVVHNQNLRREPKPQQ